MAVLLDRDGELAELTRRLALARAGAGRVIVIEGAAGIGKSTLLATAGRAARADGATVLRALCSPLEQHAAWGMARQLFEPLRTRPEWEELTVGAAGLAERALAPEMGEPAYAGDAMHAAVRGLVWLASNLAERDPAVLVVDDVHWADAPSLRWLARSLGELRIAVVCALRSGEPAAALSCWPSYWPARLSHPCARARSGRWRRRPWCASACQRRAPGSPTRAMPSPAATRSCSAPC
jgi:AAA ATPase-like protein